MRTSDKKVYIKRSGYKRLCERRTENNEGDEQLSTKILGGKTPLMAEEELATQGVITFSKCVTF